MRHINHFPIKVFVFAVVTLLVGNSVLRIRDSKEPSQPPIQRSPVMTNTSETTRPWTTFAKSPDEILRKSLSEIQYRVTQHEGTERAFTGAYWDNKREGLYVDVVSGEPLFSSRDKFDSGTGWPSFVRPVDTQNIVEKSDRTLFIKRTEVRSKHGDSHLGHVFADGPQPTGLRYCINSASLRFIPVEQLEAEGYEDFVLLFNDSTTKTKRQAGEADINTSHTNTRDVAVLAGGCFWGMEDLFRGGTWRFENSRRLHGWRCVARHLLQSWNACRSRRGDL